MAYILNLRRDPALTYDLTGTTLGTATLQSKDNEKVQVPLAPLLSTSKLIRTMVAESHLHPAIHGPLILSCDASTKALVSVRDILGTGETRINKDNIEDIKQVMNMLGVDADHSQDSKNKEYFEHLSARDEGVKLEIVFEMQDENANCASGIDKDLDNCVKKEIIQRVNDIGNEDQQGFDKKRKKKDMHNNIRNSVYEHYSSSGGEIMVKREIDEVDCEIDDHDQNYALKKCEVNVEKVIKFHEKTNYADKTNEKEKILKCRVCHYSASKPSDLRRHMRRSHTSEKQYTCAVCSSAFRRTNHLRDHMRKHTGEKPYACAMCSSAFSRKKHLEVHMRSHTGEKPYSCAICPSAFRRKDYLKDHMRRHTGEKPYTCTVCASAFSKKRSLVVHMRKHTGENPSQCDHASATSKEFQFNEEKKFDG